MALLPFAIPCTFLQLHNIRSSEDQRPPLPSSLPWSSLQQHGEFDPLSNTGSGMAPLAVHHCALEHHAVPPSIQAIALSRPWPSRASVGTRPSMPLCLGIPMYLPVQACCPPDCWIISSM